jgi:hypothetical protein
LPYYLIEMNEHRMCRRLGRVRREDVGSILRYMSSSVKEFCWLPFTPPLVAFSGPSYDKLFLTRTSILSFYLTDNRTPICLAMNANKHQMNKLSLHIASVFI